MSGAVPRTRGARLFLALAVAAGIFWPLLHAEFCRLSPLPQFTELFTESDGYANRRWALGILEQGPLNPRPHHPFFSWMQKIATREEWEAWWGGEQIFQQSPLYAYALAVLFGLGMSIGAVHVAQSLLVGVAAAFLGLATAVIFRRAAAGWVAYLLALFFAPFHAYSWPLVRDGLAWAISAAALAALAFWWRLIEEREPWSARLALASTAAGCALGLGFLVREPFMLLSAAAILAGALAARARRQWRPLAVLTLAFGLTVLPLAARNLLVGAPLLASSNRGAEAFIAAHAPSSHPARTFFPREMGELMRASGGSLPRAIVVTIAAHDQPVRDLLRLQGRKLQALFDPYEAPDNISFAYMERWSPAVRWGLRFWTILIPGLLGMALGFAGGGWRRQLWLWVFVGVQVAAFLLSGLIGRYRSYFAIFFIPWAAWFCCWVYDGWREKTRRRKAAAGVLAVLGGWLLCLGPLAVTPAAENWRPAEFALEAKVLLKAGRVEDAEALLREIAERKRATTVQGEPTSP